MKHTQSKGVLRRSPATIRGRTTKKNTPAPYLKEPHLGLMDRLLRSFNQVAPEEWIPSQYLSLLHQRRKASENLH